MNIHCCCDEVLERYTDAPVEDECRVALSDQNTGKNRFSTLNLLPRDHRDHVTLPGAPTVDNYINAVYVDSYTQRHRFIVTQTPLQNTLDDFWAMIRHQQVTYVRHHLSNTSIQYVVSVKLS